MKKILVLVWVPAKADLRDKDLDAVHLGAGILVRNGEVREEGRADKRCANEVTVVRMAAHSLCGSLRGICTVNLRILPPR